MLLASIFALACAFCSSVKVCLMSYLIVLGEISFLFFNGKVCSPSGIASKPSPINKPFCVNDNIFPFCTSLSQRWEMFHVEHSQFCPINVS